MEERGKDIAVGQGLESWTSSRMKQRVIWEKFLEYSFRIQSGDSVDKVDDDDEIPTRLAINVTVKGGVSKAVVDTGAFSIWVSEGVYEEVETVPIIPGGGASAADGRELPVMGEGRMQLGVWGRCFEVPVKVMGISPAGIPI
jgi:hypothetical protein